MTESDRPQMTIWRIRFICWIRKATNIYSECVIIMVFHYNHGCTNAPQCYFMLTSPVVFNPIIL